ARRREQRKALPPGVLGEVVGELAGELLLVRRELLAVSGREVDRVFVRDVDARERDVLVVVHLLDELPCELDRLHVRPKGTAEDALEERLQLRLDGAEHGHGGVPGASSRTTEVYGVGSRASAPAVSQATTTNGRTAAAGANNAVP